MKKIRLLFLASFLLLSSVIAVPAFAAAQDQFDNINRVYEVMDLIQKYHLGGEKEGDLANSAIEGMVQSLGDPYTQYFSEADAKAFIDLIKGESLLIGVSYTLKDDGVYVAEVFEGSPAEKAGILAGDKIQRMNGRTVTAANAPQTMKTDAAAKPGDTVTITVLRNSAAKDFTLKYENVVIPEVHSMKFEDGVGYIRLDMFTDTADEAFAKALDKLKAGGLNALVLDLRDNGGGSVDTAKKIASLFIKNGTFMFSRNIVSGTTEVRIESGAGVSFPVILLANENSASASEMLAGALQDNRVAKVVGTVTFGKGVMQQLYPLDSGGMLKVTTDEYYTPLHHKVDHVGIKPDFAVEGDMAQLFKALKMAGLKKMDLRMQKAGTSLNGFALPVAIQTLHQEDHYYVPSRLLAAFEDAGLKWDGTAGAVVLDKNGVTSSFSLASKSLLMKDGTSYLDLDKFKEQFAGFDWKADGDALTISAR